jgi:hypothetical protein
MVCIERVLRMVINVSPVNRGVFVKKGMVFIERIITYAICVNNEGIYGDFG